MHTLHWLLTALQSSDEQVARHALLLLWKRVTQDDESQAFVEMEARPWRRLGLLLFADDPLTVRTVLSIITELTTAEDEEPANDWKRAVRHRVWQSDWRLHIHDKLADCHARATASAAISSQSNSADSLDTEVVVRLLLVLRVVFMDALRTNNATTKDQGRMVDLLVELAASPGDSIASVALAALARFFTNTSEVALAADVLSYLEASSVFVDLLRWLHGLVPPQQSSNSHSPHTCQRRILTRRCQLALALLADGAKQSREIAVALAQAPAVLLEVCLGILEATLHSIQSLHDAAVGLLAAVLSHDSLQTIEVVSQLRLSGGLITLSWLQCHQSRVVRETTDSIFSHIIRVSPPSDLLRALVEQGCVVVSYLQLSDESTDSQILRWVVATLEDSGSQLTQTFAQSILQSTNHKLQRNVILSLLLLSQSSGSIHAELFSHGEDTLIDANVRTAIYTNDDPSLATNLLALAVLMADKRSTLRLDNSSSVTLRKASYPQNPIASGTDISQRIVELVCADAAVITADALFLEQHCKVIQRQFEFTSHSLVVDLREFDVSIVQLFVQLVGVPAHQVITKLHPFNRSQVEGLLTLSNRLECIKCWHAAAHATSYALQVGAIHWKLVLDLAVSHRHPALMLRAIRAALNESHVAYARPSETQEAALTVWRELLQAQSEDTEKCSHLNESIGLAQ